jgi:CRISPR-associated protein Cst2
VTTDNRFPMYEMSLNVRVAWQAHSLSNAGTNGSIRLLPRRQLLGDGTETDACSGNIIKRYHAALTAEYLEATGVSLCPACRSRDGRRASALIGESGYENMTMESILAGCGLCDAHGFLVTAKNASVDGSTEARNRLSKHSLIEFTFALALPDHHAETIQLTTRMGDSKDDGQMLMKQSARSGEYAICVRYKSVGIGVDTDKWNVEVYDEDERRRRHRAVLSALRDQVLSPSGALTSTMLPHLTGVIGAIVVRSDVGRAPLYSPLEAGFIEQLTAMADGIGQVLPFQSAGEFSSLMNRLIATSDPRLPVPKRAASSERASKKAK